MQITVRANVAQAIASLTAVHQRQVPFALARALNNTADMVQIAEQADMRTTLDIRRNQFFDRLIKIDNRDRATKQKPRVVIQVAPPNAGRSPADLLSKFEEGGTQQAFDAGRFVAYPSRDIRKGTKVPRSVKLSQFKPIVRATQLGVVRHRGGLRGTTRRTTRENVEGFVGQKGSFLITLRKGASKGRPMLVRREGNSIQGLYVFVPKIRIPKRLRFVSTAQRVVPRLFEINFRGALAEAIRTARP